MDQKVSHAIADFALRFCNELETNKTTICSPLSAETVLAMLALGCRGRARDELLQALGVTDDEAIRSSFGFLTSNFKSFNEATHNDDDDVGDMRFLSEEAKLYMANRIYLRKDHNLKPEFKKGIEDVFDSSIEQLDFEEKTVSAGIINDWVAQRTNNLIKDIVSPALFDETTSMILINAIYFKGYWVIPFMEERTESEDFHVNNTTTIQVPLMCEDFIYLNYGVSEQLNAKLLEMFYVGIKSSMVIVLPNEVEGLGSMLQQLATGHDLMADIKALKWTKVDVKIPKFRVEATINLKDLLIKLGIQSIFNESSSDFDMLTTPKKLFVSEAIQKAFIDVNEAGTEAGAATIPVMKECCLSRNPQFIADRPFLYLLLAQGVPIFIGAYRGPH